MIRDEELARHLLHEDSMVRDAVGFYFYESWSRYQGLVPLVLEAGSRYPETLSVDLLIFASRFPMSPGSLVETVEVLRKESSPLLEEWVVTAPLDLLERRADLVRPVLSFRARARLDRRRRLHGAPTPELWKRLDRLSRKLDDGHFEPADWSLREDILEALSRTENRKAVFDRLRQESRSRSLTYRCALVELAGAMRLDEATQILLDLLAEKDDLASAAAGALVRMSGLAPVRLIRERYRQESWTFRLYAVSVLQGLKFACSEACLRSLLGVEADPALRGHICHALRFHFTNEAARVLRAELGNTRTLAIEEELEKALYVNAQILGRNDPEALGWRSAFHEQSEDHLSYHISVPDFRDAEELFHYGPCEGGNG